MIDISVQSLVKAFEINKNILDGVSFEIYAGQKVGLLGANGAGKTTLFRLLTGELSEDEGDIIIPREKRLGLISQIPNYPAHYTAEDVLKEAHRRLYDLQDVLEKLSGQMETDQSKSILDAYDKALADYERLGGYEMDAARGRVCGGLNIPDSMQSQLFSSLSGGEKTRVNLARLILEETDILLLDEPTNHLDLKSVQWLEGYLEKFPGTVLLISHDRYFLDRVVSRTIEIIGGKAVAYSGNYSYYIDEKERRAQEAEAKWEREEAEVKRLETMAERMTGWGTGNKRVAKKAKAIRSRVARMERTVRPASQQKRMGASFEAKDFHGDLLCGVKNLSKAYDDRGLFADIDLEIRGGERIALIGDNGTGKTTFLKLILGEEKADTGSIQYGPTAKKAYLPQAVYFEAPNRSVLDTLLYELSCTTQMARNRLGAFLFSGEDVFKAVSDLSGGEKSRLRLCMLMDSDLNFLVLDEPTNHLDIQSKEWMEEALEEYSEALLFVSHDRYFISRFATRIWKLEDGKILDFHGGYEEYLAHCESVAHYAQIEKGKEKKAKPQRTKGKNPEKELAKLEKEIGRLEEEIAQLDKQMEEMASNYQALMELEAQKEEVEEKLAQQYELWEEFAQDIEEKK